MITAILWYMSKVWGYESSVLDRFQLQYCTQILGLKQSTTSCMIYGELGFTPVSVLIKNRILNYWCKLVNSKAIRKPELNPGLK